MEIFMKEIRTIDYVNKQAQFGNLPGDPGLPPGVTNRMINEQFGSPEREDIEGSKLAWEVERGGQMVPITVIYNVEWWEGGLPSVSIYNTLDPRNDDIEITREEEEIIKDVIREAVQPESPEDY